MAWLSNSAKGLDPFAPFADREKLKGEIHAIKSKICTRTYDLSVWKSQAGANSEKIVALEKGEALAVITGQQPGLLLGPAYTLYKILSAYAVCDWLGKELQLIAYPVFWNASEDHDLDEILKVRRLQYGNSPRLIKHSRSHERFAAECLESDEEILELLKREVPQWLDIDFNPKSTSTQHFNRLLNELFPDLLIVEPRWLPDTSGFWKSMNENSRGVLNAIEMDEKALIDAGNPLQVIRRHALPVFTLNAKSGERQALDFDGNKWARPDLGISEKSLQQMPQTTERLSPGALLRPLYAQAHLPILISILGPGEWMYHQQNLSAHQVLNIPRPILWPRLSGLHIPEKLQKDLDQTDWSLEDFLNGQLPSAKPVIEDQVQENLDNLQKQLELLRQSLAKHYKPEAQSMLGSFERKLEAQLRRLTSRIQKSHWRSMGLSGSIIHDIHTHVKPMNQPQERVQGALFVIRDREHVHELKKLFSDPLDFSLRVFNW